ncbi:uncharacterized protein LOC113465242, partial [Ceratina calcarata]|uniref:Uncharacterized protein LOC113465242 n=1 Tax=Ceratina calcarata TaxID=156304 RepID=A0AAJ7SDP1_9HYME
MICDLFIDEEGVYKPVPAPKSAPTTQNNNNQSLQQQEPRAVGLEGNVAGLESKQNRVRDSGHNIAPEYRMPPLYGEEQSSNQTQQASLQTHSSKFPIEREVVLSSGDKNSKIPILHEYKQRTVGRVAIAPDAPIKQQAWVQEKKEQDQVYVPNQENQEAEGTSSSVAKRIEELQKRAEESHYNAKASKDGVESDRTCPGGKIAL